MASVALADKTIILPPDSLDGTQVALVMINGASCDPSAYEPLMKEFQSQAHKARHSSSVFVAIPHFLGGTPNPAVIGSNIKSALKDLADAGYEGEHVVIAGHSLGGVFAQSWAQSNADDISGLILMGSGLQRSNHKINDDGTTHWNWDVPTLTINGTKDGLYRVSRVAEAWWHQYENIESTQKGMFPISVLEGTSHMSYMTGTPPSNVRKNDLRPTVAEDQAHSLIAAEMTKFMNTIINGASFDTKSSDKILAPLVEAAKLEGYYNLKPACYAHELVHADDPTCWHGSPWNAANAQRIMAGDFNGNKKITTSTDDNFHRVSTINPIHLAEIDSTCDGSKKCTIQSISVTENIYNTMDGLDTGFYPVAATEMRTKLMSRQAFWTAGGVDSPDFHALDEVDTSCQEINDYAIQWALGKAGKPQLSNYNENGVKYVTGGDYGPYNEGPVWIEDSLKFKKDKSAKTVTVHSVMMRTPTDYWISASAGFHYCKVLSPFNVLEWIYVDSLYDYDGINQNYMDAEVFLQ